MKVSFVTALMAVAHCHAAARSTVSKLLIPSYLGLWYQLYGDYISSAVIERGGYCVTAVYGNGPNNTISVINMERLRSPNGTATSMRGYAFVPNPSEPGQLSLKLDKVPFIGSYWVLALGPVVKDLYEWSIVSDRSSATLFVLARNVTSFKINYDDEVLRKLDKLGFKGFSKPIPSYQGSDC